MSESVSFILSTQRFCVVRWNVTFECI
ncbi:hypothetical protein BDFB_009412 [Asbolus verrucosus]|uniref:Uncharacterized protein n=1 Tax=Asbolus verrucosus TaxID=1661398 RepID=A0A482VZY2_ASBVE|nr:hypothetical protein BDFB_009412 [Asbolus verrucosus]